MKFSASHANPDDNRDKTNRISEEALLDYAILRFVITYITIAILCAIFYSKTIAVIMIALLLSPCIAVFILLHCTKE